MTVRDLLPMEIDIDVVDDVCEELYIAFCGPCRLTDEGLAHFKEALDLEISLVVRHGGLVVIHMDDPDESVWEHRLHKAKEFFYAAAGYCSVSDYEKWFKEDEE